MSHTLQYLKQRLKSSKHTAKHLVQLSKGEGYKDGNTNTWYIAEMAEKKAKGRAVLKMWLL